MLRALAAFAIACSMLFASTPADARKHRKHRKHGSSAHSSSKRHGHRATARGQSEHRSNMPPGWAWPASTAMKAAGDACEAELDAMGVPWQPASAQGKVPTPIEVPSLLLGGIQFVSYYRKPPFVMSCQLAEVLHKLGPDLYALGVRSVKFGSIYRNTNVRVGGKTKPFLSRHALGFAMDMVSYTDAAGLEHVVKTDYPKADQLLLDIETLFNGSGLFRTVLSPRNDPISHDDHFHIEVAIDYTKAP